MKANNVPNLEAVEASSKAAIKNAGQAYEILLGKVMEMYQLNVAASNSSIKRQAKLMTDAKVATKPAEFERIRDNFVQQEGAAVETLGREFCALITSSAADLSSLQDNNRNLSGDFWVDALGVAAQTIPTGANSPFGEIFKRTLQNQIDLCKSCGDMVDKMIKVQRTNYDAIIKTVSESTGKASTSRKG